MFSYGNKFKITIYGASHEEQMGVVIDGVKPGLKIDIKEISKDLDKRRPKEIGTTSRVENDEFKITNGVFNGYTTGAPINIVIENKNVISKDYSNLVNHPRPNHADYPSSIKYGGFNDYRGGGIFSGRLTSLIVIAGSIAKSLIDCNINSSLIQVGTLKDLNKIDSYLEQISNKNDSVGGIIKTEVSNVKPGIGEPYFNKLDATISHFMMCIPGVRGVIFGDNFNVENLGSINNDLIINKDGKTSTNHSGGIVGGISNGNDIVFNVLVKPTSSIGISQETYNFSSNKIETLLIKGRHDTAFVRRLPIVIEAACAIVLANY